MSLTDYDFELPADRIAQHPLNPRDQSKLLVCKGKGRLGTFFSESMRDDIFKNIELGEGDFVVLNEAKVLPVRLLGKRETGGSIECMVLGACGENEYKAMLKLSGKISRGLRLPFDPGLEVEILSTHEERAAAGGEVRVRFHISNSLALEKWLELYGHVPLPPYIEREDGKEDRNAYQTVYASKTGSAAAPTAGFHFTDELISKLQEKGVEFGKITLHVGIGTFRPIKVDNLDDHKMHEEKYEISQEFKSSFETAKKKGKRIVAIGTTVVRALESWDGDAGTFNTQIFIRPGYKFRVVDDLVTNFHLPRSTLLVLVSAALGSIDQMKQIYRHAIDHQYRFFSYGDAMFIRGSK